MTTKPEWDHMTRDELEGHAAKLWLVVHELVHRYERGCSLSDIWHVVIAGREALK